MNTVHLYIFSVDMRTIVIISIGIAILFFSSSIYIYASDVAAISSVELGVQSIDISKPTLTNATFIIQMNLTNPTDRTIQGLSSIFDIYIGQNRIGSGSFQNVNISPKSHTVHSVTTIITYVGLAHTAIDIIANLIEGQQTTVNIEGTMTAYVFFGLSQTTQEYTATITTS